MFEQMGVAGLDMIDDKLIVPTSPLQIDSWGNGPVHIWIVYKKTCGGVTKHHGGLLRLPFEGFWRCIARVWTFVLAFFNAIAAAGFV